MTIRVSEGVWKALLGHDTAGDKSFRQIFEGGALYGYGGVQPDSANANITGYTLLAIASKDGATFVPGDLVTGNGMEWDEAVANYVLNQVELKLVTGFNLIFKGVTGANGNMGWCRLVGNAADDETESFDLPRIDFSVGVTSGDILIAPTTKIVQDALYPATMKQINWPMSAPA